VAKRKSSISLTAIIVAVALLVALWKIAPYKLNQNTETASTPSDSPALGNAYLTCEFLDVDQADAELCYLPDGKIVLIDAGNRGDGDELVSYLKNKNITKIDYLVATHPHADHIGGISEVIDSFEIGKIFVPKIASNDVPTTKTYEDFLLSVQRKNLKLTAAKAGSTLFEGENYKAECLSPAGDDYDNLNHYSVTIRLSYGIHSLLFTGDAETVNEKEMLNAGYNLDSDVLKVGHHGSRSSSSKKFLNAVSPKYAVISCGEGNDYGHPHNETIDALNNLQGLEKYYRTDLDKTIIITLDGKNQNGIEIKTKNPTVAN
jgi:beta-lactamase superfamily II metal-dependent hydrolase